MSYEMNMKNERKPSKLIPAGEREFKVIVMEEKKSKAGNMMFVTTIEDNETKGTMDVYLIAEEGKRWMLKNLLSCVNVSAAKDGVYKFDIKDVVGQRVRAIIEHVEEEWINREGQTIKSPKAKLLEFIPTNIAWDEI